MPKKVGMTRAEFFARRAARQAVERARRIRIVGDAAIVELTRGYCAVIDARDAPLAAQHTWHAKVLRRGNGWQTVYARTRVIRPDGSNTRVYLHRAILGLREGDRLIVDHVDLNGLNCRRSNLRLASPAQNNANCGPRSTNRLGIKGVHLRDGKYRASIGVNGGVIYLGTFEALEDAVAARNEATVRLHGEFARLSEVPDQKPPIASAAMQHKAAA